MVSGANTILTGVRVLRAREAGEVGVCLLEGAAQKEQDSLVVL